MRSCFCCLFFVKCDRCFVLCERRSLFYCLSLKGAIAVCFFVMEKGDRGFVFCGGKWRSLFYCL
jgi:hypothetical protein